jgi:magnesium transporter
MKDNNMPTGDLKVPDRLPSWETLAGLVAQADAARVEEYLEDLSPAETARAISRLDDETRTGLLTLLSAEDAAEVLRDLPEQQAADLIGDLTPSAAAAIVDQLPADEQADLLAEVEDVEAEAILGAMPSEEAEQARALLQFPRDSAGGLMTTEFLSYRETMTIGQVLADMEMHSEKYSDYEVQYSYITDVSGGLQGVLRMRDLLLSRRDQQVTAVMISDPVRARVDTALSRLGQMFDEHSFMGIPVVDTSDRLVGVVQRAWVVEERQRQTKNSFLKISGIVGGEEFRSMPLLNRSFRRLSWLVPNIALNIFAASVIAVYQDTLQAVIALAVFLPIISDMSGCSGNQAVAVSMRELTLGLIKPGEFARVFLKESGVGLINGILLGVLLGTVAILWKENIYLGLVVGIAIAANTLLSVLLGGSVPLVLRKLRIDPALASAPILTTVTDMCGFFLVLSLASSVLHLL